MNVKKSVAPRTMKVAQQTTKRMAAQKRMRTSRSLMRIAQKGSGIAAWKTPKNAGVVIAAMAYIYWHRFAHHVLLLPITRLIRRSTVAL